MQRLSFIKLIRLFQDGTTWPVMTEDMALPSWLAKTTGYPKASLITGEDADRGGRGFQASAPLHDSFDVGRINFRHYGSLQELHGYDQTVKVLLANQDSFDSFQRSRFKFYAVSTLQKRMGLDGGASRDHSLDNLDFLARYGCWRATMPHEIVDPRRRKDEAPLIASSKNKNVIGKQRQGQLPDPILPSMSSVIKRQEDFHSLHGENLGHSLFVLMAGIDCKPRWEFSSYVHSVFGFYTKLRSVTYRGFSPQLPMAQISCGTCANYPARPKKLLL